jgi:hypothetical protein
MLQFRIRGWGTGNACELGGTEWSHTRDTGEKAIYFIPHLLRIPARFLCLQLRGEAKLSIKLKRSQAVAWF